MSVRGTDAGYQPGSAEPFGPNKKRVMQPKSLHRVGIGKKPVFCFTQTKIGVSGALGMAGVATGATGVGLAATPFLEAGAAVAGTVAGAARGVDYLESLFA